MTTPTRGGIWTAAALMALAGCGSAKTADAAPDGGTDRDKGGALMGVVGLG
ncbi:MAG: hypothetical protein PHU25_10680 [Deltaproteobacteria bacterium]|nr:hypothetical protein [Deltaproteobacteria bacterium]